MTNSQAIPEKWIKNYVDQMLKIAAKFPRGRMRDAALLRADHVMDMVKAYREKDKNEGKLLCHPCCGYPIDGEHNSSCTGYKGVPA